MPAGPRDGKSQKNESHDLPVTVGGSGANYCSAILDKNIIMAETTQMLSFHELFFNVDSGYLEGLVRGFRSGVLTQSDYLNLSQCETLEGRCLSNLCFSLLMTEKLLPNKLNFVFGRFDSFVLKLIFNIKTSRSY